MSAILALDLGTRTGFALWLDGRVQSGVVEFRPGRHEGAGMQFVRFRGWLERLHADTGGLGQVVYEEVRRHLGTDAAHLYGGFWATLTAWCQERRVPFLGVPVGAIKRYATGRGNADKPAMLAAAQAKLGYAGTDDNEADALWLLAYARYEFLGEPSGLGPAGHGPRAEHERPR